MPSRVADDASDAESVHSVSSLSQRFVPKEDDEETLWEVVAILAEKGRKYKVQWAGEDPKTMKPWAPTWVPKHDVTDDLVVEWKRKKKEKERKRKSTSSKRPRDSTTSRKSTSSTIRPPPSGAGSGTTATTSRSRSTATVSPAKQLGRGVSSTSKLKNELVEDDDQAFFDFPEQENYDEFAPAAAAAPRPVPASTSSTRQQITATSTATAKPQGKKRKLADAESTHTSANSAPHTTSGATAGASKSKPRGTTTKTNVTATGSGTTIAAPPTKGGETIHVRPKKKRKIEVEVPSYSPRRSADMESEEEMSRRASKVPDSKAIARSTANSNFNLNSKGRAKDKGKDREVVAPPSSASRKSLTRYEARMQSHSQLHPPHNEMPMSDPMMPPAPFSADANESEEYQYQHQHDDVEHEDHPHPRPDEEEEEEDVRMVEDQLSEGINSPPPTFETLPHEEVEVEGDTAEEAEGVTPQEQEDELVEEEDEERQRAAFPTPVPTHLKKTKAHAGHIIGRKSAGNQSAVQGEIDRGKNKPVNNKNKRKEKEKGTERPAHQLFLPDEDEDEDEEGRKSILQKPSRRSFVNDLDDKEKEEREVSGNGSSEGEVEVVSVRNASIAAKAKSKGKKKAREKAKETEKTKEKAKANGKPETTRPRSRSRASSISTTTTATATVKKPKVKSSIPPTTTTTTSPSSPSKEKLVPVVEITTAKPKPKARTTKSKAQQIFFSKGDPLHRHPLIIARRSTSSSSSESEGEGGDAGGNEVEGEAEAPPTARIGPPTKRKSVGTTASASAGPSKSVSREPSHAAVVEREVSRGQSRVSQASQSHSQRDFPMPEEEQSVFYTPSSPLRAPAAAGPHPRARARERELEEGELERELEEGELEEGQEQEQEQEQTYQHPHSYLDLQTAPSMSAAYPQQDQGYEGDLSQSQSYSYSYHELDRVTRERMFGKEGMPLWPGHLPASVFSSGDPSSVLASTSTAATNGPIRQLLSPASIQRLADWDLEVMWAETGPRPVVDVNSKAAKERMFVPSEQSALFASSKDVGNVASGSTSGAVRKGEGVQRAQEAVAVDKAAAATLAKPKSTASAATGITTSTSTTKAATTSKPPSKASASRTSAGPSSRPTTTKLADISIVPETDPESTSQSQSLSLPSQPVAGPVHGPVQATTKARAHSPPPPVQAPEAAESQAAGPDTRPVPPHTPPRQKATPLTRQGSLKSRMKPRTPGAGASAHEDLYIHNHRELFPIPMLSPKMFIPHLSSSLGESVIEEEDEEELRRQRERERRERGEEESIEEFESPVRRKSGAKGKEREKAKAKSKGARTDDETGAETGQESELEFAWRQRLREIDELSLPDAPGGAAAPAQQKPTDVSDSKDKERRSRSRSAAAASVGQAQPHPQASARAPADANADRPDHADQEEKDEDEEMRDASTAVVPPASGPRDMDVDVDIDVPPVPPESAERNSDAHHPPQLTLQQMEEAYVDLSGGQGSPQAARTSTSTSKAKAASRTADDDLTEDESREVSKPKSNGLLDPALLREEEEESTQDLMMELQAAQQHQRRLEVKDLEAGWDFGGAATAAAVAGGSAQGQAAQRPAEHRQEQELDRASEKGSDRGSVTSTSSKKGKGKAKAAAAEVAPLPTIVEDEAMAMNVDRAEGHLDVPEITIQQPSRAASVRPYSVSPTEEEPAPGIRSRLRSRSRSATPAPPATPKKAGKRAGSKAPSRTGSVAPVPPPAALAAASEPSVDAAATPEVPVGLDVGLDAQKAPVPAVDEEARRQYQANLDRIASQAELIARLEAQLASERAKNEVLQQEVLALQPRLVRPNQLEHPPEQKQQDNAEALAEVKQHVLELEEERIAHLAQKGEWESAQKKLVAELEAERGRKVDAEKDRDFFKEQYARASGFVGQVRDENKDLEKRAAIAEEQAKTGVANVRMMFESRVKMLEEDIKAWRQTAQFMIEKDRRTNDDIRRRAAEEPELRAKCARLELDLEETGLRMEELEEELQKKTEAWETAQREAEELRDQAAKLHHELSEAKVRLGKIVLAAGGASSNGDSSQSHLGDDEGSAGNGSELVYCCQWRISDAHGNSTGCKEVFSTIPELEQHLFSAGHLETS